MKQWKPLVSCGLVLALASLSAPAQEAETPPDAAAVKAQTDAAFTERRKLQYELYAIRRNIERSDAVADLRRAASEAENAAREAEKTNPALLEARKGEHAAYEAVRKAREAALKADPEAAKLLQQLDEIEDSRATLSLRAAMAEVKLRHRDSPVSRALAKDPKLAELRRATYQIRDRAARSKALKAYHEAREAAEAEIPEAKAPAEELRLAKAGAADAVKAARAVQMKLDRLRSTLSRDGKDKVLADASARFSAARKAVLDAYNSAALKAVASARDKARRALYEKVKELVAEDEDAAALSAKIEALEKKIRDLQPKTRRRIRIRRTPPKPET